ncbi:MAG TPA: iron-containing redox enzyme family protein [Myxococcaceae bacterium]|jgi:hypothetical protein
MEQRLLAREKASPSVRLDAKVRLLSLQLEEAYTRFWNHPRLAEFVPHLLFRMHCETRAAVHLMDEARRQLSRIAESEPLATGLIRYFEQLSHEEQGHDDWLLNALESLGETRVEVRARMPPPTVAAMIGMQYYWTYHHHPVALLGFIKVVENDPSSAEQIERIKKLTGLPRNAFSYHLGHVHLEAQHNALLDSVLDSLPLTPEHEALIGMNAARTIHYMAQSLNEIITLFEANPRVSATPAP